MNQIRSVGHRNSSVVNVLQGDFSHQHIHKMVPCSGALQEGGEGNALSPSLLTPPCLIQIRDLVLCHTTTFNRKDFYESLDG